MLLEFNINDCPFFLVTEKFTSFPNQLESGFGSGELVLVRMDKKREILVLFADGVGVRVVVDLEDLVPIGLASECIIIRRAVNVAHNNHVGDGLQRLVHLLCLEGEAASGGELRLTHFFFS